MMLKTQTRATDPFRFLDRLTAYRVRYRATEDTDVVVTLASDAPGSWISRVAILERDEPDVWYEHVAFTAKEALFQAAETALSLRDGAAPGLVGMHAQSLARALTALDGKEDALSAFLDDEATQYLLDDYYRLENMGMREPDRWQRVQHAAEQGANGSTHRDILHDWRRVVKERLRAETLLARNAVTILALIDACEHWHHRAGTLDQRTT